MKDIYFLAHLQKISPIWIVILVYKISLHSKVTDEGGGCFSKRYRVILNFVLIYTRCFRICSPIESIYNIMVWWWRKTENFWHSITLSVIYCHIGIQCNLVILLVYIARIISETPSRKLIHHNFWFWWTFSEAIEYIICAFILPQDVQLQLKSSPRL